ncbi:chemerin-like receptor 1 isoform 2-T2 [Anomaloglossus baeobatrachus]|uniref:chemerin-like receptor 1 isoform X2 n=1 Tax=Anomaloglossus baeobatrachus TaxID=238106 RepID=UPI003F4F8E26
MTLPHALCYSIVDIRLLIEYWDSYTSFLKYFNFVVSIVTCLLGLVGNAIVIFFLGFVMKKHKSKYWFLNLAVADFFALLTLPLHAFGVLYGTWTFGPYICKLFLFTLCVNMYASVLILISLNIARVLSVTQPMFHLKFMSQRVSFWICALIWTFTLVSSVPVFYYSGEVKIGQLTLCSYFGSKSFGVVVANNGYNVSSENTTGDILTSNIVSKFRPYFEQCSSDTCCGGEDALNLWNHLILTSKKFVMPFLVVGYFIPLVIVIICNITIIVHVRRSKTANPHRLYRIVLVIILVFFITWTPVFIAETVAFIAVLNMNFILMFNVLAFLPLLITLAYSNSCLNPIVYVLIGGKMRTGLFDFISSIRHNYT